MAARVRDRRLLPALVWQFPGQRQPRRGTVRLRPLLHHGAGRFAAARRRRNQICGFYDLNPAKFGLVDNFVTFAKNYGEVRDVYDGIDLTLNARLPRGAMVQGGLNIGREVTDLCDVVGKVDLPAAPLPFLTSDLANALIPSLSGMPSPSTMFCRVSPPFQTELKLSSSYPLPWDVQLSATIQSIPGTPIVATAVVPNSQVVPSLGRDLAAGDAGTSTVQLVEPGTMYGDRLNQVDFA